MNNPEQTQTYYDEFISNYSHDDETITPDDMIKMAARVVEYIEQTQPDIIIGCDRGGRLFSLAIHALARQINPKQPLPTLDGKLHFAHLSKTTSEENVDAGIERILHQSTKQAERTGKSQNGDKLRILFIDDFITSGGTRELILESIKRLGLADTAEVNFAVMFDRTSIYADATGDFPEGKDYIWSNWPDAIGVEYDDDGVVTPYPTITSRFLRDDLQYAAEKFIHRQDRIQSLGDTALSSTVVVDE